MKNKLGALLLLVVLTTGLVYSHPAYAHNFGDDESASFLGKVVNLKAELQALQMDLSNSDAVAWHIDKIGEYWNANDTKEMGERNQLLATEIPDTLDSISPAANQTNPDANALKQDIDKLNGYLDEAITARLDKDKLQNATVQALALTNILSETLESYGDAIDSKVDLNDMSQMNASSMGSGGMQSEGSGASSSITIATGAGSSANAACVAANNCFVPNPLNVAQGTEVEWKNTDSVSHTVTSGRVSDDNAGSLFDSGLIKPSADFKFTFDKAGTYDYFCTVHPWMTGQVVVSQPGTSGMKMGSFTGKSSSIHMVTMSDTNMQSGSSGSVTIMEMAAYTSAQMHAKAAKDYFDKNVVPLASSSVSAQVSKVDDNLSKLIDAINNKEDGNAVMTIVHMNIHPALISAFNLPTANPVPEFPLPALLVIISVMGMIMITRLRTKLTQ